MASAVDGLVECSSPGAIIGGTYRVVRHLASGGSGHVFEVEHARLGKRFALKLLRVELRPTPRVAERFTHEAAALATLKSEHVVEAVDCGALDDGTPYLVMEMLRGEDLRSLLRRECRLPPRRALHLLAEACRGLAAVHRAGMLHRDLKPENLFVARHDGGEDWCKLLDFGVAKTQTGLATLSGSIIGTPKYMAPEQLMDGAAINERADIYALGTILYECLTGQTPFRGVTTQELMYKIINEPPPSVSELCPALPSRLANTVMACLAKDPQARPASADELRVRLESPSNSEVDDNTKTLSEGDGPSAEPRYNGNRALLMAGIVASVLAGAAVAPGIRTSKAESSPQSKVVQRAEARPSSSPVVALPTPAGPPPSALEPSGPSPARRRAAQPRQLSGARRDLAPVIPESKVGPFDATDPYAR